eukprot:3121344-Prymnesium_polylepis.2
MQQHEAIGAADRVEAESEGAPRALAAARLPRRGQRVRAERGLVRQQPLELAARALDAGARVARAQSAPRDHQRRREGEADQCGARRLVWRRKLRRTPAELAERSRRAPVDGARLQQHQADANLPGRPRERRPRPLQLVLDAQIEGTLALVDVEGFLACLLQQRLHAASGLAHCRTARSRLASRVDKPGRP